MIFVGQIPPIDIAAGYHRFIMQRTDSPFFEFNLSHVNSPSIANCELIMYNFWFIRFMILLHSLLMFYS